MKTTHNFGAQSNHLPSATTSHPTRMESSITLLCKPKTCTDANHLWTKEIGYATFLLQANPTKSKLKQIN